MSHSCSICQERPATDACFVRRDGRESATCRMCWEQVFLDPRRVLDALEGRTSTRRRIKVGARRS